MCQKNISKWKKNIGSGRRFFFTASSEWISRSIPVEWDENQRGLRACRPPSTGNVAPVMNEAWSEAKNAIVCATSWANPGRPSGWVSWLRRRNWIFAKQEKFSQWNENQRLFQIQNLFVHFGRHSTSFLQFSDDDSRTGENREAREMLSSKFLYWYITWLRYIGPVWWQVLEKNFVEEKLTNVSVYFAFYFYPLRRTAWTYWRPLSTCCRPERL